MPSRDTGWSPRLVSCAGGESVSMGASKIFPDMLAVGTMVVLVEMTFEPLVMPDRVCAAVVLMIVVGNGCELA